MQWVGAAIILAAMLLSNSGAAQQIAAPLGLEVGKAKCKDAEAALGVRATKVSSWSNGPIISTTEVARLEVEGLQEVLVICNAQDTVIAIRLMFPKDGPAGVRPTSQQLDKKYKSVSKDLPFVGNAKATWQAANGTAVLEAPHLSFTFYLTYWGTGALEMYERWQAQQEREKEQKRSKSL